MYCDLLTQSNLGFEKLPNGKYFFRTSILTALLQCNHKLHFIKQQMHSTDFTKNYALVKGKLFHAGISFLLNMHNNNMLQDGFKLLDKFLKNNLESEQKRYCNNIMQQEELKTELDHISFAVKVIVNYLLQNYKSYITEKTFIIEKPKYIIKLTPDLIADNIIIDFKTTKKELNENMYISYDYALQMAIYSHFIGMDTYLLYYSFANDTILLKQPGKFENIEERIEKLIDKIENDIFVFNSKSCKTCFYKSMCTHYAENSQT